MKIDGHYLGSIRKSLGPEAGRSSIDHPEVSFRSNANCIRAHKRMLHGLLGLPPIPLSARVWMALAVSPGLAHGL